MTNKITSGILFILILSSKFIANAQEAPSKNWDAEKIKGVRYSFHTNEKEFHFLTDSLVLGKIELTDGVIIDSLKLRYNTYRDELTYFNEKNSCLIVIDKISINGFSFTENNGNYRIFRKQYYDGFFKGVRFFEVLSDGETDLLAYRKTNLNSSSPYKMDIMDYSYYFYSPNQGYLSVKTDKTDLLEKFDDVSKKAIKKLLRKNNITIDDEESLISAWKIIEKAGYRINFKS